MGLPMDACTACQELGAPRSGFTGYLLFVGAFLVCPCHLPVTIGLLAAAGAGSLVAANAGLVYGVLGVLWLGVLAAAFIWIVRRRDAERHFEDLHAREHGPHEGQASHAIPGGPASSA